jgi:23S rRNA (adenine2503-C2)-methyltransferase
LEKPLFFSLTLSDLKTVLEKNGFKAFQAKQLFHWVYQKNNLNISEWQNISKLLKDFCQKTFDFGLPKIIWSGVSKDGTVKFLVRFNDKNTVETVAIPAKDRLTLCISSQVGCAIGCTFCHTGTMGLTRHLTAGEVVGQYLAANYWLAENKKESRVTNIVYMGQGEPLHNFENMKKATEIFLENQGLGLGQRRITLSTSGMIPQIKKLNEFPPVNIAISLHAAHDKIRTELMPINKVYDLKRLLEAIEEIPLKAHRWITYEYLLIKDLNDRQEDIDAMVKLLHRKTSKVNLIPFNEYPESTFKQPSKEKILWFNGELNRRGLVTTIRTTKGSDILAACGQLKSMEGQLNLWS